MTGKKVSFKGNVHCYPGDNQYLSRNLYLAMLKSSASSNDDLRKKNSDVCRPKLTWIIFYNMRSKVIRTSSDLS